VEEQELLNDLVGKSTLPRFEVDVSDNDVQKAVEKIVDWLEKTGGLYCD
jgi:hypothetical protein